jgi:hypothetical protein
VEKAHGKTYEKVLGAKLGYRKLETTIMELFNISGRKFSSRIEA